MTKKKPDIERVWTALADKIDRSEKAARGADKRMLRDIRYGLRQAGDILWGSELSEILEIVSAAVGRKVIALRGPQPRKFRKGGPRCD